MEVRAPSDNNVTFLNFNQDGSRLAMGTRDGYHTFSCQDPYQRLFSNETDGTSIVEMLFNTSLVAQVGYGENAGSNRRCLRMINTRRDREIIRMNYQGPILAVKLNRQRLVVVLETVIYIYDIANLHLTHTISQTPSNPNGVCALASYTNQPADTPPSVSYFAYPGSDTSGLVYIYDVANLQPVTNIEAHTTAVACLALSPGGDRLATASQRGTVIRVFQLPGGEPLFEFRRGSSQSRISSMSFSPDARFLSVSSDHQTVHIFKLELAPPPSQPASWTSAIMGAVGSVTAAIVPRGYIPTETRAFAWVSLPEPGVAALCTINLVEEQYYLLVVTSNGYLYRYSFDADAGGEGNLTVRHLLTQSSVEMSDDRPAPAAAAAAAAQT